MCSHTAYSHVIERGWYENRLRSFRTFVEAYQAISAWIWWYNTERQHQTLGYRSPQHYFQPHSPGQPDPQVRGVAAPSTGNSIRGFIGLTDGEHYTLAGLIWAWREHRRALPWIAGWSVLIWGTSFWLQPTWVQDWLASVALYNDIVYTASLLPWGLLLLVLTWRLPWYAQLAAAQVVLFPVTDVYAGLPFLLTWVAIGGPLALTGSSISWLRVIAGLPNSADVFWVTTVLPLMVCAAWRLYTAKRTRLQALMTKKRPVP